MKRECFVATACGNTIDLFNPDPALLSVENVARGLANRSRYAGQCDYYSVAEHSIYVSRSVPEEYAMEALFHDAAEAFTADITKPFGQHFRSILEFIAELQLKCYAALGINRTTDSVKAVHNADQAIVPLEQYWLWPKRFPVPDSLTWFEPDMYDPVPAYQAFMARYRELLPGTSETARLRQAAKHLKQLGSWEEEAHLVADYVLSTVPEAGGAK